MKDSDFHLATEFPPATREQWLKLVQTVLKGADFDKKLVSCTYHGLRIEPLYPKLRLRLRWRALSAGRGASCSGLIIPSRKRPTNSPSPTSKAAGTPSPSPTLGRHPHAVSASKPGQSKTSIKRFRASDSTGSQSGSRPHRSGAAPQRRNGPRLPRAAGSIRRL